MSDSPALNASLRRTVAERLGPLGSRLLLSAVLFLLLLGVQLLPSLPHLLTAPVPPSSQHVVTVLVPLFLVLFAASFFYLTVLDRALRLPEGWKRLALAAAAGGAIVGGVFHPLGITIGSVAGVVMSAVLGSGSALLAIVTVAWVADGFRIQRDR